MNNPASSPLLDSPEPVPVDQRGHETTDVHCRPVILFAVTLALALAIVLVLLRAMLSRFEAQASRDDPVLTPLAESQRPPAPRLQVHPRVELKQLRDQERRHLSSYGWVDGKQSAVRIPIDRAMSILAKRGLHSGEQLADPADAMQSQNRGPR